jgi:hypothetical protein
MPDGRGSGVRTCTYGTADRPSKRPGSGEWMLSAQLSQYPAGGVIAGNPRMRLSLLNYTCWKSRPGQAYQANPTNHWAPRHCMPPLEARPWGFFTSRSDEGTEAYHAAYVASPTRCPGYAPVQR